MIGWSCLHGPHQGAQKSTSTGWRRDSSSTSFWKFAVVVSFTRPDAAPPGAPAAGPPNVASKELAMKSFSELSALAGAPAAQNVVCQTVTFKTWAVCPVASTKRMRSLLEIEVVA